MTEKQINLLPKSKLKQLELRSWFFGLLSLYVIAGISFGIVLVAQGGVLWYLKTREKSLEAETETLRQFASAKESTDVRKQVTLINNRVNDYNNLAQSTLHWSKLLTIFSQVVPVGVQIQSFAVDNTKKQVAISGYAPTRELVIQLHDNIAAKSRYFTKLDYPLENVTRPTNIVFHYTFTVLDEALK